ncbi:sirohydrochlorin ferrochelatase [Gracilibacillus orientalis]|uniref:Sirohydrochlorin ferrochelatase n=1 Tax=Gracilibacillus orientalis TaxID=334253 RepID=A0A1I4MGL3_9BACI|nr:sirohydrochlorin chelatase [Gracilibacillus orientalis]SFM02183.1 sirohydrochlorin ferrochelatase [Gracilibacillus orientalis]
MEAVIYICHGSRLEESKHESFQLINKVKNNIPVSIQETCFLELQEPDLAETVRRVAAQGATKILIMPILLLTAGHAKKDIPDMIEKEKNKYPSIAFVYGRAIEVEQKMVAILADRVKACTDNVEGMDLLLVGRGSSDMQAVNDTEKLVGMLRNQFPDNQIDKCFLAASKPKFEPFLWEKVKQGKSVLVLPYLLFTGLLDKGIKEYIGSLELKEDQRVLLADYLGDHPNVVEVLTDRVTEAREGANRYATMAERSS